MGTRNRLRELREQMGWTTTQLASHLGVHEATVSRWEKGKGGIPDAQKARLCDLFGVSLDHLMGRDNGPKTDGGNGESEAA